jgi:signal transduction histidine kinase
MPSVDSEPALLPHPHLATLATSVWPAWLWRSDAAALLWANAAGAALFGMVDADSGGEWRVASDHPAHPAAAEVARLAATLAPDGAPRFERLRGFGARFGRALTCRCSRVVLADGTAAVLVAAAEPLGPILPPAARIRRPSPAGDGPSAARTAIGTPVDAGEPAEPLIAAVPPPPSPERDDAAAVRRQPLRFVWQMDADERFVVGSEEFVTLVGPRTMAVFERPWSDIATALGLDPDNQIARAIATRETWSGIIIPWPLDGTDDRLPVELAGLPVFDRDRRFRGYRGFGVCRDIARLNRLARMRKEQSQQASSVAMQVRESNAAAAAGGVAADTTTDIDRRVAPPSDPSLQEISLQEINLRQPSPAEPSSAEPSPAGPSVAAPAANVVPFRAGAAVEPKAPVLTSVERRAFRELAQELTARLRGNEEGASVGNAVDAAFAVDGDLALEPSPPDEQSSAERPAVGASLLDRIPVGVLIYRHGAFIHANRHFLDLSGYHDLATFAAEGGLDALFAESSGSALADGAAPRSLSILTRSGDAVAVDGRLFTVRWNGGPALALILTDRPQPERNHSTELALEAAAAELRSAKREAQQAAAAKADFLAKVSHEIRTPLNAIVGFAEVIMAARFGPIGNERYGEYVKDIHDAGTQLVSLINDLVDLSKVESGQLELAFADIGLNGLIQQCVGVMQPHANRARIIIRTSLTAALPDVVADERSLRQILINLLAHAIKLTGPGGQVIVSTARADSGEVVLRVRDTGIGMSEKDIAAALEPFRQAATAGSWGSGGAGLGLPLTKALAEANRAHFSLQSAPDAGTLVEVAFPPGPTAAA